MTADKFVNNTSGRIVSHWGNQAGISIERDSIYEENHSLNRGIMYSRNWMIGKYINNTFINNDWPAIYTSASSLRFNTPGLQRVDIINNTFTNTALRFSQAMSFSSKIEELLIEGNVFKDHTIYPNTNFLKL